MESFLGFLLVASVTAVTAWLNYRFPPKHYIDGVDPYDLI